MQVSFIGGRLAVHFLVQRFVHVTSVRTAVSRLVVAYLALQVVSGFVILLAIAWCLLEIYRTPPKRHSTWLDDAHWVRIEHEPARRRRLTVEYPHAVSLVMAM